MNAVGDLLLSLLPLLFCVRVSCSMSAYESTGHLLDLIPQRAIQQHRTSSCTSSCFRIGLYSSTLEKMSQGSRLPARPGRSRPASMIEVRFPTPIHSTTTI